jgi:hypothetical protein
LQILIGMFFTHFYFSIQINNTHHKNICHLKWLNIKASHLRGQ